MLFEWNAKYKWIIGLFTIYCLALLNVFFPMIRFESRILNLKFINGIMCIPFVLFALSTAIHKWYVKLSGALLFGVLSLLSVIIIVFNIYAVTHMSVGEYDPSFKVISSYSYGQSQVKVYKIEGGAITSFGISVRHEKEVVAGIFIVNQLFNNNSNETVVVEFERDHIVVNGFPVQLKENVIF